MAKDTENRRLWTYDETVAALNLYCQMPYSNKDRPEVIHLAKLINRTPAAVNLKIGNLGNFDEQSRAKGIVGLSHTSKLDKAVWDESSNNWGAFFQKANKIEKELMASKSLFSEPIEVEHHAVGEEEMRLTRRRLNQNLFRRVVLSSYKEICCVSKINVPDLLVASHIKPWAKCSPQEKMNPHNGLCMNALHDRAFDRGLIAVDEKYRIRVSKTLRGNPNSKVKAWIADFEGKKITMPDKFMPSEKFLNWHIENVFRG